jgi:hypothetical protein
VESSEDYFNLQEELPRFLYTLLDRGVTYAESRNIPLRNLAFPHPFFGRRDIGQIEKTADKAKCQVLVKDAWKQDTIDMIFPKPL